MSTEKHYVWGLLWAISFCLGFGNSLCATDLPPGYLTYTVNDGLPSNELYAICQDREGFLWIASDRGVCRYDGKTFKTYTVADGLADNSIVNLFPDGQGRLWMLGASRRLSWYENGQLHTFPGNAFLEKHFINRPIFSIYTDEHDTLRIGAGHGHFKAHIRDSSLIRISSATEPEAAYNLRVDAQGLTCYMAGNRRQGPVRLQGKLLPGLAVHRDPLSRPILGSGDKIWLNSRSEIVSISRKTQTVRTYDLSPWTRRVSSIQEDQENNLWVCFLHNGVLKLSGDSLRPADGLHLFQGVSITSSYADHNGGIWLSTIGKGLYHIPNGACQTLRPGAELHSPTPYKFMGDEQGNYWVADHAEGLDQCSANAPSTRYFSSTSYLWGQIKDLEYLRGQGLVVSFGKRNNLLLTDTGQQQELAGRSGKYFDGHAQTYWVARARSLVHYRKSDHAEIARYVRPAVEIGDLTQMDPDHLLLGTYKGLMRFSLTDSSSTPENHPLLKVRVEKICRVGATYLLATRGAGLVFYRAGTGSTPDTTWHIGQEAGLASDLSNHVFAEGDSVVWVSTHKGLNRLRFAPGWQLQDIRTFDYRDGLASNQVLHAYVHQDRVWAGTPAGVSTFRKGTLGRPRDVRLYLRQVKVNGQARDAAALRHLPATENQVQVDFESVCFRRKVGYGYEYRLTGADEAWRYTQNEAIVLPKLAPGAYSLALRVVQAPGAPVSEAREVVFEIQQPWWQNSWLYLLAALLGGGLLVLIGYGFQQRQQRRLALAKTINDLQAKALTAQMNPHFAFNALGTVQHYIQTNQMETARIQLGQFSDLLRLVLRHSNSKWIPLEQELRMLRLYLELEADRFEGTFRYEIEVAPDFDPSFDRVPPMILQPFVENAIWHGLLPKEGEKNLCIALRMEADRAICVIQDNGVGRAFHADKPQTDHFSMGIGVTRKRLAILQPELPPAETVVIRDLLDPEKQPAGTQVTLILPLK